jgi:hypothetical protein
MAPLEFLNIKFEVKTLHATQSEVKSGATPLSTLVEKNYGVYLKYSQKVAPDSNKSSARGRWKFSQSTVI